MKKVIIVLALFSCLTIFLFVKSCFVNSPQPEECVAVTTTITQITEGSSNDIVFFDTDGDKYYINCGLERGLNLQDLNAAVLNKTVTLQLPKMFFGASPHIAELKVGDDVIYTEFD